MTTSLNFISLTIPLTAQLVFNRVLPSNGSATIYIVFFGVLIVALMEFTIKYARSCLILKSNNYCHVFLSNIVFDNLLNKRNIKLKGASVYTQCITRISEDKGGKTFVAIIELTFIPVILLLIFFISFKIGALICLLLAAGATFAFVKSVKIKRIMRVYSWQLQKRQQFLLRALNTLNHVKSFVEEDALSRKYEKIQATISRNALVSVNSSSSLLVGSLLVNQAIIVTTLVYGAHAMSMGEMTLGAVSASVLLGGRLIGPIQRAILIFLEMKDINDAQEALIDHLASEQDSRGRHRCDVAYSKPIMLQNVSFNFEKPSAEKKARTELFEIFPSDMIAISGADSALCTRFLKCIAGVERPEFGDITIDGVAIWELPLEQRNKHFSYIDGSALIFNGTIEQNITHFGEISVNQAMETADLIGLRNLIEELPGGIKTELTGNFVDRINSGLAQQISILRGLVRRPKYIVLDNVESGLDKVGYSNLQMFLSKLSGNAAIICGSRDKNLLVGANRSLYINSSGEISENSSSNSVIETYRELRL